MNPAKPPVTKPAPEATPPALSAGKKRPWALYIFGGVITVLLGIIAVFAILLWWSQRPIKPVVLSAAEKATVEAKLEQLGNNARPAAALSEPDRIYAPGTNVLQLTEREINGLLNANTDLGQTVRLEFGRDAINAYVAAPIPADVPLFGGKMFRARGRIRVSLGNGTAPVAMLEDVTVYGVSLPKAWLGGLKGENLITQAMGETNGASLFKGIKSLRIQPGSLLLELEH